jgi:hypothetical protein
MKKKTILIAILTLCMGMILNGQMSSRNSWNSNSNIRNNNIPGQIPFQGRLADDLGNPINGIMNITFSLYEAETAGIALWSETQAVNIENGLFSLKLGSLSPLSADDFSDSERWIGIVVDADSEMSPRTKIASVPYAFTDDDWSKNGNDLYFNTGRVAIGNSSGDTDLNVYSVGDNEGITLQTDDNSFKQGLRFRNSGGAYTWNMYRKDAGSNQANLIFANGAESDINNLSPKVTFQNDGNVGIGTDSPDEKLSVVGKIRASNDAEETEYVELNHGGNNANINWNGDGDLNFSYNNSTLATLKQSGDFNIPSAKGYQIGDDTVLHKNGPYGIFLGKYCGNNITSGEINTFVGQNSGEITTEGSENVFLGYRSGQNTSTGSNNSYVGAFSGCFANGNFNSAIGYGAGNRAEGGRNVFIGAYSGLNDSTGVRNTFLGFNSGINSNGDRNVFLGYAAGSNETDSDKLYIANTNTSTPLIWGDFSTEELTINGTLKVTNLPVGDYHNVQWDASTKQFYYDISSQRYKENISELTDDFSKLLKLSPKTYTRPGKPERQEIGYIAEELDAAGLNKLVWYNEEGKPEGINYEKIILYTNENVKLLKQENEELKNTIIELIKRIELLENK